MLALGQYIMCNEELRTPLLSKANLLKDMKFLIRTANGNGDIFYGPTKAISNSAYPIELVTCRSVFDMDRPFTDLFQGTAVGLPRSFRTRVRSPSIELHGSKNSGSEVRVLRFREQLDVPDNADACSAG